MIAAYHAGALGCQFHNLLGDDFGVRAVANDIPEDDELVHAHFLASREAGFERRKIGVNIGNECKLHGGFRLQFPPQLEGLQCGKMEGALQL